MPTYQYHCDACGKEFEAVQRMSEAPLTDCTCGAKGHVHRLLSAGAGVIFKGSGFYQTDYKPSGAPASNGASESKSEPAKTESKPAHTCGGGGCGCAH